jgi:hypothetical protein
MDCYMTKGSIQLESLAVPAGRSKKEFGAVICTANTRCGLGLMAAAKSGLKATGKARKRALKEATPLSHFRLSNLHNFVKHSRKPGENTMCNPHRLEEAAPR